jgi:hypothetical protein
MSKDPDGPTTTTTTTTATTPAITIDIHPLPPQPTSSISTNFDQPDHGWDDDDNYQQQPQHQHHDDDNDKTWTFFGAPIARSQLIFVVQIVFIFLISLVCVGNLTLGSESCEESTAWIALLSSVIGYVLPAPRP